MTHNIRHKLTAIAAMLSLMIATMLPLSVSASEGGGAIDRTVYATTGINPNDYPCAKAGITALFQTRMDMQDLSVLHPKRIFMWVADIMTYFAVIIVNFFKKIFNPQAIQQGLSGLIAKARHGQNPFAGTDRAIENALHDISPSSKVSLTDKVKNIINDTTNDDGSCKLLGG